MVDGFREFTGCALLRGSGDGSHTARPLCAKWMCCKSSPELHHAEIAASHAWSQQSDGAPDPACSLRLMPVAVS